jgi:S-methylmethionine-dependent homocysteine/selenocysteine methylase
MTQHFQALPQLTGQPFLTDGGLETTLIFRDGFELPHFAAFHLLSHAAGRAALERYFRSYAAMAKQHRVGCVLESATWRASRDWGDKLGYTSSALLAANRAAIDLLLPLAREYETAETPMVISGCVGPRGDGYRAGERQSASGAEQYHREQIGAFSEAGVDLVTAMTMTNSEEAIGIVRAARSLDLPVVVSFTVETDGKLPTGQALEDALAEVDAATERAPAYYMINCAHPVHFQAALPDGAPWLSRIHGLRANASTRSHAELDESTELDDGDPEDLAERYARLTALLPSLNVIGGCCGTDERHVAAMCRACMPLLQRQPSALQKDYL